jgi:RNA polymerase sigma-70 factor (ECF subfamily)
VPQSSFPTTRWTLIVAAGRDSSPGGPEALADLCARYWKPLYAFARRDGHTGDQAQDLTQAFFARFLEKHDVRSADPARGRFRSFMLTSFKHFLANARDRDRAQKRGGGRNLLPIDLDTAESWYVHEPADTLTPDAIFEQRWALDLIDRVKAQLAAERANAGGQATFERLQGFLLGEPDAGRYEDAARELGRSAVALRVTVHRMRRRFRELLRVEIAATVADDSEIDAEIRHLIDVLSR